MKCADCEDIWFRTSERLAADLTALEAAISELADGILGPRPDTTPIETLQAIDQRDTDQAVLITVYEMRISGIAHGFGADPVQATEDDLTTIEAGIAERARLAVVLEASMLRLAQGQTEDAKRIAELEERQQAHLALISEVGTLRSRVAEMEAGAGETSASIAAWADSAFGEVASNMSTWERADDELVELRNKLIDNDAHPPARGDAAEDGDQPRAAVGHDG